MKVNPKDVSTAQFHGLFLGVVAPRPIAFVSSVDKEGNVNLAPYSFFNAFSANPPTMIFSPARSVRDNTTKHTLQNVEEHQEVVINIVNYDMVQQMSLASTAYEKGVNEFVKAGLTEVSSEMVKPPRVGESPASFECKVTRVIHLGQEGGAGNLIFCEVLLAHFDDKILDENQKVNPYKLDAVARMGGNWYCRANYDALFEVAKPLARRGMGVDQLPEHIRNSTILTGNDLGKLGNTENYPTMEAIEAFAKRDEMKQLQDRCNSAEAFEAARQKIAAAHLKENEIEAAWLALMVEFAA